MKSEMFCIIWLISVNYQNPWKNSWILIAQIVGFLRSGGDEKPLTSDKVFPDWKLEFIIEEENHFLPTN